MSVNCKLTKSLVVIQTATSRDECWREEEEGKETNAQITLVEMLWAVEERKNVCKNDFVMQFGERKKSAKEKCLLSKWNLHTFATAFCLTNCNIQFISLRLFISFSHRLYRIILEQWSKLLRLNHFLALSSVLFPDLWTCFFLRVELSK